MVVGPTTFDFGIVARGAKADHRFVIENIYEETAHIKSVTSSCQCSKPTIGKRLLKTWEKTEFLVTLDTRAEPGRKDGTIEVEFDLPFPGQASASRPQFHSRRRGGAAGRGRVRLGRSRGRGEPRTEDYLCRPQRLENHEGRVRQSDSSKPAPVETSRVLGTPSKIAYSLSVELKKSAPPGYIREPLVLVTNDADARSARVPVNIEGLGHRGADGSPRVAGDGRGGNRQAGHLQSRRARACAVPHRRHPFERRAV